MIVPNDSAIELQTINYFNLEHKKRYNVTVVIGEEKYIHSRFTARLTGKSVVTFHYVTTCLKLFNCFIGCKDKTSSWLFSLVFAFLLSLKPQLFVQSFFDTHAPQQPPTVRFPLPNGVFIL